MDLTLENIDQEYSNVSERIKTHYPKFSKVYTTNKQQLLKVLDIATIMKFEEKNTILALLIIEDKADETVMKTILEIMGEQTMSIKCIHLMRWALKYNPKTFYDIALSYVAFTGDLFVQYFRMFRDNDDRVANFIYHVQRNYPRHLQLYYIHYFTKIALTDNLPKLFNAVLPFLYIYNDIVCSILFSQCNYDEELRKHAYKELNPMKLPCYDRSFPKGKCHSITDKLQLKSMPKGKIESYINLYSDYPNNYNRSYEAHKNDLTYDILSVLYSDTEDFQYGYHSFFSDAIAKGNYNAFLFGIENIFHNEIPVEQHKRVNEALSKLVLVDDEIPAVAIITTLKYMKFDMPGSLSKKAFDNDRAIIYYSLICERILLGGELLLIEAINNKKTKCVRMLREDPRIYISESIISKLGEGGYEDLIRQTYRDTIITTVSDKQLEFIRMAEKEGLTLPILDSKSINDTAFKIKQHKCITLADILRDYDNAHTQAVMRRVKDRYIKLSKTMVYSISIDNIVFDPFNHEVYFIGFKDAYHTVKTTDSYQEFKRKNKDWSSFIKEEIRVNLDRIEHLIYSHV